MEYNDKTSKITKVLFFIYLIALFEIIVFKLDLPFSNMGYLRSVNLIPFSESLIVNGSIDFSEILMNSVIFIPLGIYMEMLFKKWSTIKKVSVIVVISLICEVSQFIMAVGASDITDIINNTIGGVIGLLLIKILIRLSKNKEKVYKVINILASVGTILMILLLSAVVIANL